ncbi:MAG: hypothetical protein ACO3UU_09485, partial [Minisyncoccia bacterium]
TVLSPIFQCKIPVKPKQDGVLWQAYSSSSGVREGATTLPTLPSNSYVKATTTLISPNTAISVYKFGKTTGHGAIKNLLITDTILLTGYKTPGIWGIELNADSELTDPVVYTGTLDNIVSISPEPGSLTRSISSTQGDITDSELQFNVYHTWGPNSPVILTTSTSNSNTTNSIVDTRPYIDIAIPNWSVIDVSEYSNGYYSEFAPFDVGIYHDFLERTGTSCLESPFSVENKLSFELKLNTPSLPFGAGAVLTDIMAWANIYPGQFPYPNSTSSIIKASLDTVSQSTSANTINVFNGNQTNSTDLFDVILNSARTRGITEQFIEDIAISQIEGRSNIRLIFNKESSYIPDYINVYTSIIDHVDVDAINEVNDMPGLGPSTVTTTFYPVYPS